MESWEIKGKVLEYDDKSHTYIYDGVVLPSVTQIIKNKFPDKYKDVPKFVLNRAAKKGTALHKAIQDYEEYGICSDKREFQGYLRLRSFEVVDCEKPIVVFSGDKPIAAGRFDLLTKENGVYGLEDIKRTQKLDLQAVALQLNLYRIGLYQSYGIKAEYLKCLHLREDVAERVGCLIDESVMDGLVL